MEFDKKVFRKILRSVFLGVIACIVVYWLLHDTERATKLYRFIKGMLSPFIVGAVLAFIINVPMRAIEGLLKGIEKPGLRRA